MAVTLPYKPVLVPVDRVTPAVYNPREADTLRLEYLRMSISYLGFVLPLYATPEGHLLSGHQRLTIAKQLGVKHVPVCFVDVKESLWKQANLLFNRAQPLTEPVATPGGWVALGDLEVGDMIMGRDGRPHTITAITERKTRQVYRVEFDDGVVVRADPEHLWTVDYTNAGGNTHFVKNGTFTTEQISAMLEARRRVAVPRIEPLELPDADLPLDPWLLGVLLGDGSLTPYGVRLCSSSPEWCFAKVAACVPTGTNIVSVAGTEGRAAPAVSLTGGARGGRHGNNPVLNALRALGLAGVSATTKFVPHAYLWASKGQRLALLQGLMDTDGCAGPITPVFTTTSPHLVEAVEHLVWSLGGKAASRVMREADGTWSKAYQVTVRLPEGVTCFTRPDRVANQRLVSPRIRRRIVGVHEDGVEEVACITVSAPDHLYLTRAFIPTHNCTNDMDNSENSEIYLNELESLSLEEMIEGMSPKTPDTDDFYPCMQATFMTGDEITAAGIRTYSSHGASMCRKLLNLGIIMPALRDRDTGKVVNGSYRVYAGLEEQTRKNIKAGTYPMVNLSTQEATLAEALVNLISMKFTVEKQFGDLLRYGGYRRPQNKVEDLVVSFRYWADGRRIQSAEKSLEQPRKFWHNFRKHHGEVIADMGAGQRRNGLILRKKGIKCVDWEPYPCDWQEITGENADRPSLTLSRMISNEFLDEVEAGTKFDSIFANAVLNSIPFHKDRMAFLALCHAISSFHTSLYGTAKIVEGMMLQDYLPLNRITKDGSVSEAMQQVKFQVPYESGVILADISKAPKVQKHHTRKGLETMLRAYYVEAHTHYHGGKYQFFEAHHPRRVNPYVLREALEMEFNMPYPDNQSMNLHERAIKVFSQRHNLDLADPKYAPAPETDAAKEKEAA